MVWQELTRHIEGRTVQVRSKDGNEYPAEAERDHLGESIYRQLVNDAHDDITFWAWVEFEDCGPIVKDFTRGEMPDGPPWDHP